MGLTAPLYEALRKYAASRPVPFHMPGHKLGRGFPAWYRKNLCRLDVTEIPDMDNLHSPTGVIAQAQRLAAEAFKADRTYFLVNGSTVGIHGAIYAACRPGERIAVARDCHKSVVDGIGLAGARPVYIKTLFNLNFGIPSVVDPAEVEKTLDENPDIAAVLITRPNYYGICSDLKAIERIVHSRGKLLIVDEAHGAHLAFSPRLPAPAMEAGADICVQSAHKTLPALTQGAYLHIRGSRVDSERLEYYLDLAQTTSPSFLIMSSLDIAREIMQREGERRLGLLLDSIDRFKKDISALEGLLVLGPADVPKGELDAARLVINVRGLGMAGFEAEGLLRSEYKIQVEMSDLFNIVCISTVSDSPAFLRRLAGALKELARDSHPGEGLPPVDLEELPLPEMAMAPGELTKLKTEKVELKKAVGRISAGMLIPYPPGIPVIFPGEVISGPVVDHILRIVALGGKVNGLDGGIEVRVVV